MICASVPFSQFSHPMARANSQGRMTTGRWDPPVHFLILEIKAGKEPDEETVKWCKQSLRTGAMESSAAKDKWRAITRAIGKAKSAESMARYIRRYLYHFDMLTDELVQWCEKMARYIVRQQRAQLTTQLNKTKELIGFADRKLQ